MELWEKELREHIVYVSKTADSDAERHKSAIIGLLNCVQKQKILAKVNENKAWIEYFKDPKVNMPEMCKHFEGMNMKYGSILERMP